MSIADAYTADGFDFTGTRNFDKKTGYRSKSFLTVPMRNHEHEIIGVLQLINALRPETGEIVAFSASDQQLAESLASQAAIALTNRMLINQLEQLFESFIALINTAIDEKSPYTGGHCQRVPALTMMLAEAVSETIERHRVAGGAAEVHLEARGTHDLEAQRAILGEPVERAAVGARDRLRRRENGFEQPVDVPLRRQRRADGVQLLETLHQVVGGAASLGRDAQGLGAVERAAHALAARRGFT